MVKKIYVTTFEIGWLVGLIIPGVIFWNNPMPDIAFFSWSLAIGITLAHLLEKKLR